MPESERPALKNGMVPAAGAARDGRLRKEPTTVPVVGIGASAGGLQAFIHLLEAVPEQAGMAFVLIQHLSPDHKSLMAKLLGARTNMTVRQINGDMLVERDSVYINAPGQNVSLSGNMLVVSDRPAKSPVHLPFDFFLLSLAVERTGQAMCVVLSGTGQDGTKGLKAIKHAGGFVIAQAPRDAEYDGMPRSAIETGDVDAVLTSDQIPAALMNWNSIPFDAPDGRDKPIEEVVPEWLGRILQILREKTGTDFSEYKSGTLVRRITRRISLVSATSLQATDYIKLLLDSPDECEALAADLLINVTRFFRDPSVFDYLESSVLPDLVRNHPVDRPIRFWVAGCSSGEEAWTLAILLREAIDADGRELRIQILASDIDADAIATARAAEYPSTIESDVTPERLANFFTPVERGYRIRDDLRRQAVFTVQNLLSDPPFSRLDLVSCRNVLIYLGPEAQAKIVSNFEFALVSRGILLLGASETGRDISGRFEVVSKPARVYRRLERPTPAGASRQDTRTELDTEVPGFLLDLEPEPDVRYADVIRRAVAQYYTPASVLVTRLGACLHFVGPVDQFLEIPEGSASLDISSMVPLSHRVALRGAIDDVGPERPLIQLSALTTRESGKLIVFETEVRFLPDESGDLVLITFHEPRQTDITKDRDTSTPVGHDRLRLAEISALRQEIAHAGRLLDRAQEIERKTRRESLRLNEEYQSTNEELVTSKEELQSLNEELTVLNSQLQETIERQRTTADDLTNVLNSTNVATVFLDLDLCIRFFTPATRTVFGVIATDIGRPISDLRPLALDLDLLDDAHSVIESEEAIEREIATTDGVWFRRRVLPYRSHGGKVEGIVITYVNVAEQHRATETLKAAIRQAEHGIIAKNRFLASASHDLRQPLQTLTIIHSLLSRDAANDEAKLLISRMEHSVSAMSGMLNTLLDINQIQAGIVTYEFEDVPIKDILVGLFSEFSYHARAKSLDLRMAPSSAIVKTDRRLFEQMIRNLLSNAIRYTDAGRILIGCRRRSGRLRIEIWDTGIGISDIDLPDIFGEYHKVATPGRAVTEGVGLGLSIVQRLADLLGHRIHVRSWPDKGSMFSIEVDLANTASDKPLRPKAKQPAVAAPAPGVVGASVLVAEDDPDLRQLIEMLLKKAGHRVATAATFDEAVGSVSGEGGIPDLLIADYNLPSGRNGIELARTLTQQHRSLRVIILTGDISAITRSLIAEAGFVQMNKPVGGQELETQIQALLQGPEPAPPVEEPGFAQVMVVDDDLNFCETLCQSLQADGVPARSFSSGEAFLANMNAVASPTEPVCVLIDAYLGGISGFEVLEAMKRAGSSCVAIMITGNGDVNMAVQAMKAGAVDFIEKPIDMPSLRTAIDLALSTGRDLAAALERKTEAAHRLGALTAREREVLARILSGQPNKNIAADLGISQRTVESHRASVMQKTKCKSLPELVRLSVMAA